MQFKELIIQTPAQLEKELSRLQGEAASLAVTQRLGQVKNKHKLGEIKKDIARLHTALNQMAKSDKL